MKILLGGAAVVCLGLYLYYVAPVQFKYNPLAQHDLKTWCEAATTFDWGDLSDPSVRARTEVSYSRRVTNFMWTFTARDIFYSLNKVEPSQRWELLQQAGRDIGMAEVDCPALKELFERDAGRGVLAPERPNR